MNTFIKIFVLFSSLFLFSCSAVDSQLEDKFLDDLQSTTNIKLSEISIEGIGNSSYSEEKTCRKILANAESKYQEQANATGESISFGIQCFQDNRVIIVNEAVAVPEIILERKKIEYNVETDVKNPNADTLIFIEKSACYGNCPAYRCSSKIRWCSVL